MSRAKVVIVGAGHAGTALAGLLRQGGHRGEIVLFGEEHDLPYQRPPLSKKFGGDDFEHALRPAEFFVEQAITWCPGDRVTSLDPARKRIALDGGRAVDYDFLVLATGARARRLTVPGARAEGVLGLRTLGDARRLRAMLAGARKLAIVGGGYIGLEVAAAAGVMGVEVTVLERESRLLARVASKPFAARMTEYHRSLNTTIVTGAQVVRFHERDGRVAGVGLADGQLLGCDLALVGVGAVPRDELAAAAGLTCDNGIVVGDPTRTSDASIFAIGDVTRRPVPGLAGGHRLESIPSATEQARQACAAILGTAPPRPEVPWFWSDQHELNLKIAGVVRPGPVVTVRARPSSPSFSVLHHENNMLTAIESVNAPADFMAARKFIATGQRIDPAILADPEKPLRAAAAA
jgi:3-phenylpropionate/trans-cinnamate dioxygenase ferredoxin reductase subunit